MSYRILPGKMYRTALFHVIPLYTETLPSIVALFIIEDGTDGGTKGLAEAGCPMTRGRSSTIGTPFERDEER